MSPASTGTEPGGNGSMSSLGKARARLRVTAINAGIGRLLIGTADQEEDGQDQMNGDDRCDHQRGNLAADGSQVQEIDQLHLTKSRGADAASTVGVNRYPPERTVLIMLESCGSVSILRRMRLTSTSIERSNEPALRPCVRSSRLSRDKTRPGRSQKARSRSNSADVIETRAPAGLRNSRRRKSIRQP